MAFVTLLFTSFGALGYACSDGAGQPYVPLAAGPGKTYAERLGDTTHAFAPRERSSARRTLEARMRRISVAEVSHGCVIGRVIGRGIE